MDDSTSTHAMTEIALALAMAFFALMILTLVSMGAGEGIAQTDSTDTKQSVQVELAASAPSNSTAATQITEKDFVVIYDGQRFLSQQLEELSVAGIEAESASYGRIVLALPPNLPFQDAVAVRTELGGLPVTVTQLSQEWMDRL